VFYFQSQLNIREKILSLEKSIILFVNIQL